MALNAARDLLLGRVGRRAGLSAPGGSAARATAGRGPACRSRRPADGRAAQHQHPQRQRRRVARAGVGTAQVARRCRATIAAAPPRPMAARPASRAPHARAPPPTAGSTASAATVPAPTRPLRRAARRAANEAFLLQPVPDLAAAVVHPQPREPAGRHRHEQRAGALHARRPGRRRRPSGPRIAAWPPTRVVEARAASGCSRRRRSPPGCAAERASGPGATKVAIAVSAAGITVRSTGALAVSIVGKRVRPPRPSRTRHRQRAPERVGRVDDVGVGEQQPLAPRRARRPASRPTACRPSPRAAARRRSPGHARVVAGGLPRGGQGAVARLVVDDDHLDVGVLEGAQAARRPRRCRAPRRGRARSRSPAGPRPAGGSRSARGATRRSCTARATAPAQRAAATPAVQADVVAHAAG